MMFHDVSMSSAGILEVKDSELQEVRVSLSGIQDSDCACHPVNQRNLKPPLARMYRMRWTK